MAWRLRRVEVTHHGAAMYFSETAPGLLPRGDDAIAYAMTACLAALTPVVDLVLVPGGRFTEGS